MPESPAVERQLPSRADTLMFQGKASLFRLRRALQNLRNPIPLQKAGCEFASLDLVGLASSELWTHQSETEFPLTAGKIHNLRIACQALNGLEIPAGAIFSFWKQLGRVTRRRGFVDGRELREGCLIPSVGGGLCQLSNLLYSAALDAGFEVMERHAHSRKVPGSLAERDRDATVFWNYVDLRFRSEVPYRLETTLTDTHIVVKILVDAKKRAPASVTHESATQVPSVRGTPSGDCLTCGMTSCFRNSAAVDGHLPASGHTAFVLDEVWPEFQQWCTRNSNTGDHWLLPLDGQRWRKANYAWLPPVDAISSYAALETLFYAFRMRRLPAQGALRQKTLLKRDACIAGKLGRSLDPAARHVIVSQNLLPHLWQSGHLGGRTFDVLMTRWPLDELQNRLDEAASHHPNSPTLTDFRVDRSIAAAERIALNSAARLVTPHRAIAAQFGSRALLLDWVLPESKVATPMAPIQIFFPASPLGRKGIYEVAEAFQLMGRDDIELVILGRADEGSESPLKMIPHRFGSLSDLKHASVVVLPASIEHRPRMLLLALASGIPVISTASCGLPKHPDVSEVAQFSSDSVASALRSVLLSPTESGGQGSLLEGSRTAATK